jgi:hypothetical protein
MRFGKPARMGSSWQSQARVCFRQKRSPPFRRGIFAGWWSLWNHSPFSLVLHNCAARLIHLESVLEAGARCYHFGAPMDLAGALARVDVGILLCGNLDPAAVFCQASPEVVRDRTRALLAVTAPYRNFVISSGCDIPPATSLENVDAFFEETASALVHGDKVLSDGN